MKHFSVKTLTLSTILGAILLSGCGETANDTLDELHEVIVPNVSNKLQRADNANQNRDIDLKLSISSTMDTLSLIIKGNNILETDRGITFIDADNNPATGYRRGELGAEYLLIGSALYKNVGGNGYTWKWNMLGHIDKNRTNSNNEMTTTLKVDRNLIQTSKTIKAFSYLYDGGFNGALATSSTISHTMTAVNNKESRFTATEPTKTPMLTFTITDPLVGTNKDASENIFIDIDGNTETGYFNWYSGKLGAEFLISGNNVYRYKDASGYGWNWEKIGKSHRKVNGKSVQLEMDTPPNFIGGQSKAVASMYDSGWHVSKIFDQTTITDNPEDGGNVGAPSQALAEKLLPDGVKITSFTIAPNNRGAIIRTQGIAGHEIPERFTYAPILYVDYSDLQHPRLSSQRFDMLSEWALQGDPDIFLVIPHDQIPLFLPNERICFTVDHDTAQWEVIYNYLNGIRLSLKPLNIEAMLVSGKKFIDHKFATIGMIEIDKDKSFNLDANPKQWHMEYTAKQIIQHTEVIVRIVLIYDEEFDKTYFISKTII